MVSNKTIIHGIIFFIGYLLEIIKKIIVSIVLIEIYHFFNITWKKVKVQLLFTSYKLQKFDLFK
ncbi:hypothetical protein LJE82_12985 [bacterium BMS3Abin03]|nr:hypothetical protein [bacterium BMS3Abin03]